MNSSTTGDVENGIVRLRSTCFSKPSEVWYNGMLLIAFASAVSFDPLFFYIPIINEDRKCVHVHSTLKTTALAVRSVMDLIYLVHIVYQIYEAWEDEVKDCGGHVCKVASLSIVTDILCLIPIPQVLFVVVFFRMKENGYLEKRDVMCFSLLIQYVVRIYRIFLSSKKLSVAAEVWIKAIFNLFLYITCSHVFGAFWYFFAVKRETFCWLHTCGRDCASTFNCDQDDPLSSQINEVISRINSTCHWSGTFDYGIFKSALASHYTESTNILEKLCYCFWWGLRNLSNYGTSLDSTSNYPLENMFAVLVSVSGLLIFLYLIGNVQTYMQMRTSKSEKIRVKFKTEGKHIDRWMNTNNVPQSLQENIRRDIKQKLEEDEDAKLENLFNVITSPTAGKLKRHLIMDALLKLPTAEKMNKTIAEKICENMNRVVYPSNHVFVQAGDKVEHMIFILEVPLSITPGRGGDSSRGEGTSSSSSTTVETLTRGSFYGAEQLLGWATPNNSGPAFGDLPTSNETVKFHKEVEGFTLSAAELKTIVEKHKKHS